MIIAHAKPSPLKSLAHKSDMANDIDIKPICQLLVQAHGQGSLKTILAKLKDTWFLESIMLYYAV